MATPQQPPQQPIYPRDLSLALDRTYAKFTVYTDARLEQLSAQMRIGYEESLIRDNDLANSMRALADSLLRLAERVGSIETRVINIETRVTNIETTQQTIINRLDTMQQKMTDEFATQAERHNELMARVGKLEQNQQS